MTRVYISGPMTGLPELNFPAFHQAAGELRALGLDVVNPAEINPDAQMSWEQCMRADIKALCDCDTIVLLPGWENSRGAHLEVHLAHRLGIKVQPMAPGMLKRLAELKVDGRPIPMDPPNPPGFATMPRGNIGSGVDNCGKCAGSESEALCERLPCSPHERADHRWVYFVRQD